MILAGDIGGTKTILALYKSVGGEWLCHKKETFQSGLFDSFEGLLDCFLANDEQIELSNVCIGVAGPIIEGDCITTNLPWQLKREGIKQQVNANKVILLNDLEATAWGILGLDNSDFVELNKQAKRNKGHIAVLAAGTGLGEALIIWSDNKYHVVATEGGHTDFAPRNTLEIGLLQFLLNTYPEHVSNERVVCGQGLVDIYQYLKSIKFSAIDERIDARIQQDDAAAVISEGAMQGDNLLCVKALQLFCELYGAEAGNLALKCLPKGGVVLAGGIAAKILPCLEKGDFMKGYLAKGRYDGVLRDISVKVCLNPEAGLMGAKNFAITMD